MFIIQAITCIGCHLSLHGNALASLTCKHLNSMSTKRLTQQDSSKRWPKTQETKQQQDTEPAGAGMHIVGNMSSVSRRI